MLVGAVRDALALPLMRVQLRWHLPRLHHDMPAQHAQMSVQSRQPSPSSYRSRNDARQFRARSFVPREVLAHVRQLGIVLVGEGALRLDLVPRPLPGVLAVGEGAG